MTWLMAEELKSDGVEIFVVAARVCGAEDGHARDEFGYCTGIRADSLDLFNATPDSIADQRLLKCVASSPDHYQRVDVAGIPDAFTNVAIELATRSLLQ